MRLEGVGCLRRGRRGKLEASRWTPANNRGRQMQPQRAASTQRHTSQKAETKPQLDKPKDSGGAALLTATRDTHIKKPKVYSKTMKSLVFVPDEMEKGLKKKKSGHKL